MQSVNPRWKGTGTRPWLQGPPVASYDRNQGGANSQQLIYPLDGSTTTNLEEVAYNNANT